MRGNGGRCVGLTTLPPSWADSFGIWEPQPPGTLTACKGLYRDCLTFAIPWRQIAEVVVSSQNHALCKNHCKNKSIMRKNS